MSLRRLRPVEMEAMSPHSWEYIGGVSHASFREL